MNGPVGVASPGFDLLDHNGRQVSETTFLGQHALLFFGFTRCRVVCPRALAKLSAALDRLSPSADKIAVLYVTLDPDRDDPETMRKFLAPWPRILGLTGDAGRIDAARVRFRVFARREEQGGDDHRIAHSAFTHLLDPAGRHVDHWGDHLSEDEVARRLAGHLGATSPPRTPSEAA